MAYNVLFTSLYAAGKDEPLRYYYAEEDSKRLYTDVMLTVEASTKYILSKYPIDEIIILGRHLTYDAGDDERILGVDEGQSFYASDINDLSTYSLFRYRLSQFKDDLKIEQEYIRESLSPMEQMKAVAFIQKFYSTHGDGNEHRKFTRFFDRIVRDAALYDEMKKELRKAIPESEEKEATYVQWIKNYLYMNLKESSKLEILEENEHVKIRFVLTQMDEAGRLPIDTLLKLSDEIAMEDHDGVKIYIAMSNDDMTDNFLMLGVLDILDTLYGKKVDVMKVCTTTEAHYQVAGMIRDNSEAFGMSSLVSAARAFLKYGKADMIVDFWEHNASKNDQVEKMIYAMRRIDTGLSLCCIADIEKGIGNLRELFMHGFDLSRSDYYSKLFILMSEGIKKDYGRLVTSEDAMFIDLVKWANEKGFYQQCLTLIEAKAPTDMVMRGMLYYCNDQNEKQHVTDLFARKRNGMRPNEYWLMDDIDHYFLKNYFYYKTPSNTIEHQRENAKTMLSCIDNTNPDFLTGYTACDDRQALEDLLFAYLHVGRVRNETNHANDESTDRDTLFPSDKDISTKMIEITEAILYFIQSYDRVLDSVKEKAPTVIRITPEEVRTTARALEREAREAEKQAK